KLKVAVLATVALEDSKAGACGNSCIGLIVPLIDVEPHIKDIDVHDGSVLVLHPRLTPHYLEAEVNQVVDHGGRCRQPISVVGEPVRGLAQARDVDPGPGSR